VQHGESQIISRTVLQLVFRSRQANFFFLSCGCKKIAHFESDGIRYRTRRRRTAAAFVAASEA